MTPVSWSYGTDDPPPIDEAEVSEALDELDELQRRMLVDLVHDRSTWRSDNYSRDGAILARALGAMSISGLTEKIGVGTFPTPLGRRVAEKITAAETDARLDSREAQDRADDHRAAGDR